MPEARETPDSPELDGLPTPARDDRPAAAGEATERAATEGGAALETGGEQWNEK